MPQLQNVELYQSGLYKAPCATSSALIYIVRAAMIHDSTPYRVLKISELTRLIAGQLVLIGAGKSAVNLACVCRSLEEPILSTLWETQSSSFTLLGVLPKETRKYQRPEIGRYVVRSLNPPPERSKA